MSPGSGTRGAAQSESPAGIDGMSFHIDSKRGESWKARFVSGALFFLFSLVVLSGIRLFFFWHFRSAEVTWPDFWPGFVMGARVDAKWLSILFLPAWIAALLSIRWPELGRLVKALSGGALAAAVIAGLVNVGFYAFYGTPISSLVFGFFQDDTWAILKTLASDWPIFTYISSAAVCIALPFLALRGCRSAWSRHEFRDSRVFSISSALLGTAALALCIRGSVSTFPLRLQDFAVSPMQFVNDTVPNGLAAFYEAMKEQRALDLRKGGPEKGLRDMGFESPAEARALLEKSREGFVSNGSIAAEAGAVRPHVVFALMESMGRDLFESHDPETNDMLGALEGVLPRGYVFRKGIAVRDGTFPSLEGLLYDTPITPISQSRYGHQRFPFSNVIAFKKAGYRTVFLTSGPDKWRSLDKSLPLQGFDEVIGGAAVKTRFPEAEYGVWGVGDEWTFKYARELLDGAEKKGEKLFLMILSVTNHPPYRVPDGRPLVRVDTGKLPDFVVRDLPAENQYMRMQTYRYSANALGLFVKGVEEGDLREKTLIAATGDHNSRYTYKPEGWWPHANGVPLLFWAPGSLVREKPRTELPVSSRDVFPTLRALALGESPLEYQGRNLFGPLNGEPADTFTGIGCCGYALSEAGAAALGKGGAIRCYAWSGPKLVPAPCGAELSRIGSIARAKRALADYEVRSSLLGAEKASGQ